MGTIYNNIVKMLRKEINIIQIGKMIILGILLITIKNFPTKGQKLKVLHSNFEKNNNNYRIIRDFNGSFFFFHVK